MMKTIVLFLTASHAAQTVLSTTVDCAEPCRNGLRGTNMNMAECLAKNCGSLYGEVQVSLADNFIYNDFNYGQCKQDKPLDLCECKRACFVQRGVPRKQRECTDGCDDIHTSTSSTNEDEDTSTNTKDESVATAERSNEDTESADELDADSYDEDESIDTEERTVTYDDSDSADELEGGAYDEDEDEDESMDTEEERSSTSDEDSGDATSTANTDQERDTYDEEDESGVDTETDNNNPADVKAGAYEREYRRMRKVYV
eukprot:120895_1